MRPGSGLTLLFLQKPRPSLCRAAQAWGKRDGVVGISFLLFSTCLFLFLCFTYNSVPGIFGICEGIFVCRVVQLDVSGEREALDIPIQPLCCSHSPRDFCSYFKDDKNRPPSR